MAIKRSMPNKKTVIAIAIAIILLIVAVSGTVIFLKDRGNTQAAELETMQQREENQDNQNDGNPEQGNDNQGTNPEQVQGDNNTPSVEQPVIENGDNNQNVGQQPNANGNPNVQNNGRPAQTDNIQEATIERIETVEVPERKTFEGSFIGWTPMELVATNISDKMNTESNNGKISISKKATTTSGENVVKAGGEILYTITVTNNTENKISNVEVKDIIPANTTYVENSADNEATKIGNGLMWTVDIEGKATIELTFKVTVNENITGEITNIAYANNEETEPVKTAIIKADKIAVVTDEDGNEKEIARVGDTINYTISVENTGDIEGTTNVQDAKLKEYIEKGILEIVTEPSNISLDELYAGKEMRIASKDTMKIEFSAKVIKVDGEISNTATIGGGDKTATVETRDMDIKKEATLVKGTNNKNEKAEVGDTINYAVTIKNNGSEDLTVTIKDSMWKANKIITVKAGETVTEKYSHTVVAADMVNDNIKNIVTATSDDLKEEDNTHTPTRRDYGYRIEYYYDNEIDSTLTENGTAEYGKEVKSTNVDTNKKIGYKEADNNVTTVTITENEETNVIKIYYVRDDSQTKTLKYTVRYYKDNTEIVADKIEVKQDVWVNAEDKLTVQPVNKSDNKYIGYRFSTTDPAIIPEKIDNNGEIKVYYVKDENQKHSVKAQVEYYYGDTLDAAKAKTKADATEEVETAETWIGEIATVTVTPNVTDKFIGYKYETTEGNLSYSVLENVETDETLHIVKVYYVKDENQKHSVKAQVEYYYGDTLDAAKAKTKADATEEVETAETWIGEVATVTVTPNATDKFTGYKYETTEGNLSYSVLENVETDETLHIVKVYYVKDENQKHSVKAQVEYYYGDTLDAAKAKTKADATEEVETAETWMGEVATVTVTPNVTDKFIGYKYETTEGNLSYSVLENVETDNTLHVVKVYYVKDENQKHSVKAQVEYYYGDTLDAAKAKAKADATEEVETAETWIGEVATVTVTPNVTDKFIGYKYETTEGNLSYSVLENVETDNTLHIVKVYYVKDENQKHSVKAQVEYYYGDTLDAAKAKTKADATEEVETAETWIGEVATVTVTPNVTDKFIGYKYETTEGNLSYSVLENVETDEILHIVKVYYVKDENQKHSVKAQVEYYYGDTLDAAKAKTKADATEEVETAETWIGEVATVTVTPNVTDKFIGYKYETTEGNLSYSVLENVETDETLHVVKVYYIKDSFGYTVNYLDEDNNPISNSKIGEKKLFDTEVTENAKAIEGYELVDASKTSQTIKISADESKNIINFIYKAKDCEYTVNYYYNGKLADVNETFKASYGTIISGYTPKTNYKGKEYTFDKEETTSADKKMPLVIGLAKNIINVYYTRPELSIKKEAVKVINNGETISYTITVTNTGMREATNVVVSDELPQQLDMTKISNISDDGKYEKGKITWNIAQVNAKGTKTLTFNAKVKIDTIGENIVNNATAKFGDETITTTDSNNAKTKVNDKTVTVKEITEGKDADNLNIIFIMDNSSSMNDPVNGVTYKNSDSYYVAPGDVSKTRIYAAKQATKQFITEIYSDPKMTNTNMSVITFNNEISGTKNEYKIGRGPLTVVEPDYFWQGVTYKDSEGNTVNSRNVKQATDGKYYEILDNNIKTGTIEVGSGTSANHASLLTKVENISIGSRIEGLATYINPALEKANTQIVNYKKENNNKNIVIVLGDGAINDKELSNLNTLKQNADDIYCIRFGNEQKADANLTTISTSTKGTSDKLYTAGNQAELIEKFKSILDATKTDPVDRKTGDSKQNGTNLVANIESGEIVAKTSKAIIFNKPLVIKRNGTTIITCNSVDDLAKYGIKYDATNKVLRWDLNECLRNDNGISDLSGKLELDYYIPNN